MDGIPIPIPTLDLENQRVISALGRGAKGVVFLVRSTESPKEEFLALEKEILSTLQHPLLPRLRGVVETERIYGYAIDYCSGGDLHSLRKKQTEKMFSDNIIRFYAAELVLALEYLHGLGFVYRDLKPENVMIQENGHLMLIDFDLSTKLPKLLHHAGRRFSSRSGTHFHHYDGEIKLVRRYRGVHCTGNHKRKRPRFRRGLVVLRYCSLRDVVR